MKIKKTRPLSLHRRHTRRGNVMILSAVVLVLFMGLMAMALDVGYLYTAQTQLQRSADAAAIAAAWELVAEDERVAGNGLSNAVFQARVQAGEYASMNKVGAVAPSLAETDVTIGYRSNIFDRSEQISLLGSDLSNTVHVNVQRTGQQNGEVPLFFARTMGFDSTALRADATAALLTSIKGFTVPADRSCLGILPFALDKATYEALCAGQTGDHWAFNSEDGTISPGGDGVCDTNLYPDVDGDAIDSAGNRGTVDIGSANNSTADISRQILEGISPADMEYHNGRLELDACGQMPLNGDTGISAGFKEEFESIVCQTRIIPVFEDVSGNGNNATFKIVEWVGVRIMDVKLTGPMSGKHVMIQPACVMVRGAIPADPRTQPSSFIFSPVVLVE